MGVVHSTELAYAMPANRAFAEILFAARNGQANSALVRTTEELADKNDGSPSSARFRRFRQGTVPR